MSSDPDVKAGGHLGPGFRLCWTLAFSFGLSAPANAAIF